MTGADDPFVEACSVVEDGVAGVREVDTALGARRGHQAGAVRGGRPRGSTRCSRGCPRRPCCCAGSSPRGGAGLAAGQGFYPYPQPAKGYEDALAKLEWRDDVAVVWLANPPANSLAPTVVTGSGARGTT